MKRINLVILGGFAYPRGMADTKRIQHIINGLKAYADVLVRVVVMRQSSQRNALDGVHQGVPYETVMGDLLRARMLLLAPVLHMKARKTMRRVFRPGMHNVLYVYGPPGVDNLPTIRYARHLGFRVVFDIVEDDNLAREVSKSPWHRVRIAYVRRATEGIASLADGIVVISSRLEEKFRRLTSSTRIPVHWLPVSVDMDRYPEPRLSFGDPVTLFYAGSFALKDGLPVLLDAFDKLSGRRKDVRLVMTGVGSDEDMRVVHQRIAASPNKDRIVYEGYLDDDAYYSTLNGADILCMPRIDIGFAQAGFPFKLGEYLATGKPVIASSVSDIPNLLEDRKELMLVAPGDSDAFVEAAKILMKDEGNAFRVGAHGRAAARRLFDYRTQSRGLHEFLRGIVERHEETRESGRDQAK